MLNSLRSRCKIALLQRVPFAHIYVLIRKKNIFSKADPTFLGIRIDAGVSFEYVPALNGLGQWRCDTNVVD